MKRKSELYLQDILEAIAKIEKYTDDYDFTKFKNDELVIDGTMRNLEVIGEASSQLPTEFKNINQEISWQEMINFRNVVIHKYHQVDVDILWNVIENKLNPLKKQIEGILK